MRFPSPLCARAALVSTLLVFAGAASTAPTASASLAGISLGVACPNPTVTPFVPWGDRSSYAFVTNGGLENGAAGWTLTGGAAVVSGNESFAVHSSSDSASLSLPAGSTATTPQMCVGLFSTKMRFFVRNTANPSAKLHVQAIYHGGLGQLLGTDDFGTVGGGAWHPSKTITLTGGLLPLLTQSVTFRFQPVGSASGWQIDDVYLDPLLHR